MNNLNYIYNQSPARVTFPNSKNENWRYFNLQELEARLDKTKFSKKDFSINYSQKINTHLKIDNSSISVNKILPEGISVDIVKPKDFNLLHSNIKKSIGKIAKIDNDYFISENTQKFNQIILIRVKKDCMIESKLFLDINVFKKIELIPRFFVYSEPLVRQF